MPPEGSAPRWSTVVSRREARLLFWLVVLALVGIVFVLYSESLAVLATPAIILFVAWLMSYVLEPPVTLVQRHLPFRGRGVAVAITYLVTAVIAFVVIAGAGVAVINAAVAFIDNLPAILSRLGELLTPVVSALGLSTPGDGSVVAKIQEFVAENAGEIADGITALARNAIVVVASLVTAVIISVGLAMGQVSLLGWLRRFLPSSTYRDLTELEGGHRGLLRRVRPGPARDRRDLRRHHRAERRRAGHPVRPAHRRHRRADRVHPVDRPAHRLGGPARLRPHPGARRGRRRRRRSASWRRSRSRSG